MLISTKGRYALRVMVELAQRQGSDYTRLDSVAEEQQISEKYLEGIISPFSKAGLVEGMRGRGGGYRLTREPADYTVGEILRTAEGNVAPVSCLECKPNSCVRAADCKTLPVWEKLDGLISGYLDSVTLDDVVKGRV